MKKTMLQRELMREVLGSPGRFLSIMGMIGLGVFVLVGLGITGPRMRENADEILHRQETADLTISSPLGLDEGDLALLSPYNTRLVYSLDLVTDSLLLRVMSPHGNPDLVEGRMPAASGEIALDQDVKKEGYALGQRIEFEPEHHPEGAGLTRYDFVITGFLHSVDFPEEDIKGSSNVGGGSLSGFAVIPREDFALKRPGRVDVDLGLTEPTSSSAYRDRVLSEKEKLEGLFAERPAVRLETMTGELREKIDEGTKRIEDSKKALREGEETLDQAKKKVIEGKGKLRDGEISLEQALREGERKLKEKEALLKKSEEELKEGEKSYESARLALEPSREKFQRGKEALEEAEKKLSENSEALKVAEKNLREKRAELEEGERKIREAEGDLPGKRQELQVKEVELRKAREELTAGLSNIHQGEELLAGKKREEEQKLLALFDKKEREILSQGNFPSREALASRVAALEGQKQELSSLLDQRKALEEKVGELERSIQELRHWIDAHPDGPDLEEKKRELLSLEGELAQAKATLKELTAGGLEMKLGEVNQHLLALQRLQEGLATLDGEKSGALATLAGKFAEEEKNLASKEGELTAKLSEVEGGLSRVREGIAALEKAQGELPARKKALEEGRLALEKGEAQWKAGLSKLREGQRTLESQRAELDQGEAKLKEGEKKLDRAREKLTSGREKLEAGKKALEEGREKLVAESVAGREKLTASRREIEEGEAVYEKARGDFEREKAQALEKIQEGEKELSDAKDLLRRLRVPKFQVKDRLDNPRIFKVYDNAHRVGLLTLIFPSFFFFIALLVSLTTMTRMVEEERTRMGTLKALGYGKRDIARKFVLYGLSAALVGGVAGILLGHLILMPLVIRAYTAGSIFSKFPMKFYPGLSLFALGIGLLSTLAAILLTLHRSLREKASELMRPRPPKGGSRIFLERISPIWKRLSFIQKVTARNIFRYKERMLMTIIGVLGCTALIFLGFGIRDSLTGLIEKQFERITTHDLLVVVDPKYKKEDLEAFHQKLHRLEGLETMASIHLENLTVRIDKGVDQTVALMVPMDVDEFSEIFRLQSRRGNKLALTDAGGLVSEKLWKSHRGESLKALDEDGHSREIPLVRDHENYIGHDLILSKKAYESNFQQEASENAYLLRLTPEGKENRENLTKALLEEKVVLAVQGSNLANREVEKIIGSLDVIVAVMILCSFLLALVVLYNLTNINISERIRELSTIKVLGFTPKEVTAYVFRETLILTIMGIFLGLLAGMGLKHMVITILPPDNAMLDPENHFMNYLLSSLLTLLFTGIVMLGVHRRLKKINMVEALKAVE